MGHLTAELPAGEPHLEAAPRTVHETGQPARVRYGANVPGNGPADGAGNGAQNQPDPGRGATAGADAHSASDDAPHRLPLRPVAHIAARASRVLCDARTPVVLRHALGVADWQATVEGVAPRDLSAQALAASFDMPGVLELAHAAGPLHVAFDLAAHPALAIAASPARAATSASADSDRALRTAILGVLLEPLFRRVAALGLGDLHVVRLTRGLLASDAQAACVTLALTLDGRRIVAQMALTPALVAVLEQAHAAHMTALARRGLPAMLEVGRNADESANVSLDAHAALRARLGELRVPGRLVLGARRLSIETLRALAPGDVLLRAFAPSLAPLLAGAARAARNVATADGARPASGQMPAAQPAFADPTRPSDPHTAGAALATAAWGTPGLIRLHAPAQFDGHTLVITKEPTMSDELDPVRADDALADDQAQNPIEIGELDLPVQFEVDTVALPLSQLCALRPGYVLELPTPVADAQLKLVTHGQTIGYGELVTVGEHLGIRILRMAHGDGPVQ
ncbi:type III secretion system cytoplasmic ring protein SctQ [Paraburkholderia kururiensis]|uniref:Type III secretion system cytoplasmic ring protein SctQ n=1 Tax=Paraburkholderia kururiensis TaxID=984307 RepID=A0ABZ0WQJ3_9BURK|nr:type III secretion system cytoplasmic ring protein SctQ [Paraburkholderia kururiensis]WQD79637.1 type III secretion system cytoplasmic ring protein SctQ [Paraburkholderia kururiensis]